MSDKADISKLFQSLHGSLVGQLRLARETIAHPTAKGDASEAHWIDLLNNYLPQRYRTTKAFVIDAGGNASDQIDIVIHDRQYSPLIFEHQGATYVPAESLYAVFEVKQEASAENIKYAQAKVASVRRLERTSLPVPHIEGVARAKEPQNILGGLLCVDSSWKPALGNPLRTSIEADMADGRLDLSCIAAVGVVEVTDDDQIAIYENEKALTLFLLRLISLLQQQATVPMLDVMAYARWLE